jgi:hypothetical protein
MSIVQWKPSEGLVWYFPILAFYVVPVYSPCSPDHHVMMRTLILSFEYVFIQITFFHSEPASCTVCHKYDCTCWWCRNWKLHNLVQTPGRRDLLIHSLPQASTPIAGTRAVIGVPFDDAATYTGMHTSLLILCTEYCMTPLRWLQGFLPMSRSIS